MNTMIKTEKLTKKFNEKTAVNALDLEIYEGEIFGLLGVNGAGIGDLGLHFVHSDLGLQHLTVPGIDIKNRISSKMI